MSTVTLRAGPGGEGPSGWSLRGPREAGVRPPGHLPAEARGLHSDLGMAVRGQVEATCEGRAYPLHLLRLPAVRWHLRDCVWQS